MSNPFEWYFCPRCQRERLTINPVPAVNDFFTWTTLGFLPVLLAVLRHFALPVRCSVCFAPLRSSFRGTVDNTFPQPADEIDRRLSIFDANLRRYSTASEAVASESSISRFFDNTRGDIRQLKEAGFEVGGRHEKILHVARIYPEYLLQGYVAKFFYLLFLPITFFHFRHRRSKNPHAHFFPLDTHRAGRVILTDKRLVVYCNLGSYYFYRCCSIPYAAIREVRQYQSSMRVQMNDRQHRTLTFRVGQDLGELLRAIHALGKLRVRDADQRW